MNQRQFADFFEINLRTLQGWEHGKQPPEGVVSMMERILCAEWNPKDSK